MVQMILQSNGLLTGKGMESHHDHCPVNILPIFCQQHLFYDNTSHMYFDVSPEAMILEGTFFVLGFVCGRSCSALFYTRIKRC